MMDGSTLVLEGWGVPEIAKPPGTPWPEGDCTA